MPRKKAIPRWDVDLVQPLTIGAETNENGEAEPTDICRFSTEQFEEILAHLNLRTGVKAERLKHQLEYLCASAAFGTRR